MDSWTPERIRQLFESFSPTGDASDPKEQKRQKIIGAASSLFEKFGYRKTSIDDIAKTAGVAKGTVYLYAKTKADLMVQVIVEEKKSHFEEFKDIFEQTDPQIRLRKWVEVIFLMMKKMPISTRLLKGDKEIHLILEEMDPSAREQSENMSLGFLAWIIDEAAAPHRWNSHELADRAKTLQAFAYAAVHMAEQGEKMGLSTKRLAALFSQMLVDGIAHGHSIELAEGK